MTMAMTTTTQTIDENDCQPLHCLNQFRDKWRWCFADKKETFCCFTHKGTLLHGKICQANWMLPWMWIFLWQFVFWRISFYSLQLIYPISAFKLMNGIQCEYLRKRRWRRNILCSRYGSLDVLLSQIHSYVPEYDCNSKLVFIGPESDHWLPMSLTIKLAVV